MQLTVKRYDIVISINQPAELEEFAYSDAKLVTPRLLYVADQIKKCADALEDAEDCCGWLRASTDFDNVSLDDDEFSDWVVVNHLEGHELLLRYSENESIDSFLDFNFQREYVVIIAYIKFLLGTMTPLFVTPSMEARIILFFDTACKTY